MDESIDDAQPTTGQFSLGYVFFVTTIVAIAFGLCAPQFHPAVRRVGLSIVLFWAARGVFATSSLLPKVARELVFLVGLPLYAGAIIFFMRALATGLFELVDWLT